MLSLIIAHRATDRWGSVSWENPALYLSPVSPTVTPSPTPHPVRPAPVPFDANAFYDAMLRARSYMEQLGGSLDRAMAGESQSCAPFTEWHNGVSASPTYSGVPTDWGGIYSKYDWAVNHAADTTGPIVDLCLSGGGNLIELNFGVARMGIGDALARLSPAIEAAAGLLGR